MYAMSSPPPRVRAHDPRTPHTFQLRDDLCRAFALRARELECSVDWLVAEAMKRLLAETGTGLPAPPRTAPLPPVRGPHAPPPPPPPPVRARIALHAGAQRAIVDRDRFVIGRSAKQAHFIVADPNVSRQHAIVERTPQGWIVVDMASTNGVLLNGARVTRAALRPGDVLEIGPARIAVERA